MSVQRARHTRSASRAERLQRPDVDRRDRALTLRAMEWNPRTAWWWGHGKREGINAIICNLCEDVIVERTGADKLSARARVAILTHRQAEADALGIRPGNDAGATVASADAPPSGGSE